VTLPTGQAYPAHVPTHRYGLIPVSCACTRVRVVLQMDNVVNGPLFLSLSRLGLSFNFPSIRTNTNTRGKWAWRRKPDYRRHCVYIIATVS
jgi:hypothetical protein